ncbi:hypothetical protein [Ectobacillus polymachus]|uniref:hypothetical protein n=1 Tax=Ectobacillus polymachus TaxID=1508806 RepID=UPI003A88AB5E
MNISNETKKKMEIFAREQSQFYLSDAELSYIERLRKKGVQTMGKVSEKLSLFKGTSDKSAEAQGDMLLYMSDYMEDLMSQGMSELDAFEKAKQQLAFESKSVNNADLKEKYLQYYENLTPEYYEKVGLFYGGFVILGLTIGALLGFLMSGGVPTFLKDGWIYTLVGCGVGLMLGVGLGLISNAIIVSKKNL